MATCSRQVVQSTAWHDHYGYLEWQSLHIAGVDNQQTGPPDWTAWTTELSFDLRIYFPGGVTY